MSAPIREAIAIHAAGRVLGGELAYPGDADPCFAALVIGPHPYLGGTMQNALIAAIADALAQAGGVSLRFDYGGAGRSSAAATIDLAASMSAFWTTGHAPEDPARIEDAAAAFDALVALDVRPLVLIGYSFGASAAWRFSGEAARPIAATVLVSPTLARHEFPARRVAADRPALVIHSADDFCTPEARVAEWIGCLGDGVRYSRHPAGNHFFRGAEAVVGREVADFALRAAERSREFAAC